MRLSDFREIWIGDFEFKADPGERPGPIWCFVAKELRSGRIYRLWQDELEGRAQPPCAGDRDALFVAYYASAEMGAYLALKWPMPLRLLDLYVEFRVATSGLETPCGRGLLGALTYFGLNGIEGGEKAEMRELAIRGAPFTPEERHSLLAYCETDVAALERLLKVMEPRLDLERALLRGRYMKAVARMEWAGVPIDTETLETLRSKWTAIQERLVQRIDTEYGVFEGRSFKRARFESWLQREGIPWPRLASGVLDLSDDTFRERARAHPKLAPLRELRHALSQLRLSDLTVGSDRRNRCLLSPFASKTGRNQPSNSKFIFGPSVWLRHLIQPEPGRAVAYCDFSQQELGIAAALSGDRALQRAYETGDVYLAFARQAGAVPPEATKHSHGPIRDLYKTVCLGVNYGMGSESLAIRIRQPEPYARELLRLHRQAYSAFWAWSQRVVDFATLRRELWTVFGWRLHVDAQANVRSLMNWPMQANGAEILRLACCLATERGLQVDAPVHDALLVEARATDILDVVAATQELMVEASRVVLGGFALRVDHRIIVSPKRYEDSRGAPMWSAVTQLLNEKSGAEDPGGPSSIDQRALPLPVP